MIECKYCPWEGNRAGAWPAVQESEYTIHLLEHLLDRQYESDAQRKVAETGDFGRVPLKMVLEEGWPFEEVCIGGGCKGPDYYGCDNSCRQSHELCLPCAVKRGSK